MIYGWLAIVIILVVIELITVNLVTIWFIASGLLAMIISMFTNNMLIQFFVFSVGGTVFLIITKPMLDKKNKHINVRTNLDRVLDMKGVVSEKIDVNKIGEVKVDGKKWSALSDEFIETGTIVKIVDIDGVKLKVKKEED